MEREALIEELEELKDSFADLQGQYRAECALFGDAGPAQGLAVQSLYARIRLLERALGVL